MEKSGRGQRGSHAVEILDEAYRAAARPLGCRTCLVQVGRKAYRTRVRDAGDRTQVFVDGRDVFVGHVALDGPRHDLENIGGEGRRCNATLRA